MTRCGRRTKKTCAYCNRPAVVVCNFPADNWHPCGVQICGQCAKDGACRIHAIRGDVPGASR